jgi:hypothetical protein
MTPLRRGRGGRRRVPLGSKRAREEDPRAPSDEAEAKPRKDAGDERKRSRSAPEGTRAERERKPQRRPAAKRRRPAKPLAGRVAAVRASLAKSAGPRTRKAASAAEKGGRAALASLLAGLRIVGGLIGGGLAEIWAFWIRSAEIAGGAILWAERAVRPYLIAALRGLRRALAFAERVVTPERALAVVVVAVAVVLAISQFVDYRGVEIGAPAYEGVEAVAPAPQTDREQTGSVHGYAMVPVAVVMIAAALLALGGRWRLARVIPLLGALVIAVSLLLDARRGLDEEGAGIAYEGANAVLIEGFWLQLSSAAVLIPAGLLLSRYARLRGSPVSRLRPRGRASGEGKRRLGIAGIRGVRA